MKEPDPHDPRRFVAQMKVVEDILNRHKIGPYYATAVAACGLFHLLKLGRAPAELRELVEWVIKSDRLADEAGEKPH